MAASGKLSALAMLLLVSLLVGTCAPGAHASGTVVGTAVKVVDEVPATAGKVIYVAVNGVQLLNGLVNIPPVVLSLLLGPLSVTVKVLAHDGKVHTYVYEGLLQSLLATVLGLVDALLQVVGLTVPLLEVIVRQDAHKCAGGIYVILRVLNPLKLLVKVDLPLCLTKVL
uniref:Uncharacterized protein n=1 Tax=Physcomitrium patens TaxID=3218 RepID=A0A2K1JDS1_PHYPA|nr:hypothetical protein PHYPA_019951 [Physcomitrium patens]PNR39673.1 hypothetical protein PHYPA_019952 [Physcomitrium patens]PNR39674.1 hypothetical protein PHYPA_019953 [Physcomitrium patens]